MKNIKEEFLAHVTDRIVKCAIIIVNPEDDDEKEFILRLNHSPIDFSAFLNQLDFEYDNESAWDGLCLIGTIWYNDGAWSERDASSGYEFWNDPICPDIPNHLK